MAHMSYKLVDPWVLGCYMKHPPAVNWIFNTTPQIPWVNLYTSYKALRVLYDNYNGDWTAFSHPDVMTVYM